MDLYNLLNTSLSSNSETLGILEIVLVLILAFVMTLPIVFAYKRREVFGHPGNGFLTGMLLFSPISALIVLVASFSLPKAFGIVASLSIIRFRTPIKNTLDSIFLFWTLGVGVACGAGHFVAAILLVMFGLLFLKIASLLKVEESKSFGFLIKTTFDAGLDEKTVALVEMRLRKKIPSLRRVNYFIGGVDSRFAIVFSGKIGGEINLKKALDEIQIEFKVCHFEVLNASDGLFY